MQESDERNNCPGCNEYTDIRQLVAWFKRERISCFGKQAEMNIFLLLFERQYVPETIYFYLFLSVNTLKVHQLLFERELFLRMSFNRRRQIQQHNLYFAEEDRETMASVEPPSLEERFLQLQEEHRLLQIEHERMKTGLLSEISRHLRRVCQLTKRQEEDRKFYEEDIQRHKECHEKDRKLYKEDIKRYEERHKEDIKRHEERHKEDIKRYQKRHEEDRKHQEDFQLLSNYEGHAKQQLQYYRARINANSHDEHFDQRREQHKEKEIGQSQFSSDKKSKPHNNQEVRQVKEGSDGITKSKLRSANKKLLIILNQSEKKLVKCQDQCKLLIEEKRKMRKELQQFSEQLNHSVQNSHIEQELAALDKKKEKIREAVKSYLTKHSSYE